MTVLVLRPEPGASRTAQRAREIGLDSVAYPLFMVTALPWTGPEPYLVDAVMITSANGARYGGPQLARYHHLPAFAVGAATAQAVRDAGFTDIHIGEQGVQAMIDAAAAHGHRAVLHISGRDISLFDPGALRVMSACVYASVESGNASALADQLSLGMVVLVHSPRAGERLAALVSPEARSSLHIAAISSAALAAAGSGWATAVAAPNPNDNALLALAASMCE